jgi:hypothetical protein
VTDAVFVKVFSLMQLEHFVFGVDNLRVRVDRFILFSNSIVFHIFYSTLILIINYFYLTPTVDGEGVRGYVGRTLRQLHPRQSLRFQRIVSAVGLIIKDGRNSCSR